MIMKILRIRKDIHKDMRIFHVSQPLIKLSAVSTVHTEYFDTSYSYLQYNILIIQQYCVRTMYTTVLYTYTLQYTYSTMQ